MGLRRTRWLRALVVAALAAGAGASLGCETKSSPPPSVFLNVAVPFGTQTPDELRVYAYDERGMVMSNRRLPAMGMLVPLSATSLGTVTIFLRETSAGVRLDVRGLNAGQTRVRATASLSIPAGTQQTVNVTLGASAAVDGDSDGVPDPIDNCPKQANPDQASAHGDGAGDACRGGADAAVVDGPPAEHTGAGGTGGAPADASATDGNTTETGGLDGAADGVGAVDAAVDGAAADTAHD